MSNTDSNELIEKTALLKPTSLMEALLSITVDKSQANRDLGCAEEYSEPKSLYAWLNADFIQMLNPLMGQRVNQPTEQRVELGEFDSQEFVFTATKVGRAMRNGGEPAFILTVRVDGYAPTTLSLKVTETYLWGQEPEEK